MIARTADSRDLRQVATSRSRSATRVQSRVGCERLRHNLQCTPVRAAPEKHMEYKEGFTLDH